MALGSLIAASGSAHQPMHMQRENMRRAGHQQPRQHRVDGENDRGRRGRRAQASRGSAACSRLSPFSCQMGAIRQVSHEPSGRWAQAHAISGRHGRRTMGGACSPLAVAHRCRSEDLLGSTDHVPPPKTLRRFPHVERFLFALADRPCGIATPPGRATRAVRLSVSAGHELWAASDSINHVIDMPPLVVKSTDTG